MNLGQTRDAYSADVVANGGYVYTKKLQYSVNIATQKQTEEIHVLVGRVIGFRRVRILDLGCGDGTYTLELLHKFNLKRIVGFDVTKKAIVAAKRRIPKNKQAQVEFQVNDIYHLSSRYMKGQFDLGILRGVLHHLEYPQQGIQQIANVLDTVVVLEPNGFNPIMKLIEKTSIYHIQHGEKSYWPPTLDRWFANNGYHVAYKKYFDTVPYFCPDWFAKALKFIEPLAENIPGLNRVCCGVILILYQK